MYTLWSSSIIFSWRWWINIALTVLPWVIWLKVRDKENTSRLLFVGVITMLVTNCLNNIGLNYHLWHYDWKITPLTLMFIPWDYALFPVGIMLLIQVKPKVSVYIKAFIFAFITAFVFEPFYSWLGLYQPVHWKYWYSFIIYIPLFLIFTKIYHSKLLNAGSEG